MSTPASRPPEASDAGAKPEPFAHAQRLADNAIERGKHAQDLAKAIEALKSKLTPEQPPRFPRSRRGSMSASVADGDLDPRITVPVRRATTALAGRAVPTTIPRLRLPRSEREGAVLHPARRPFDFD